MPLWRKWTAQEVAYMVININIGMHMKMILMVCTNTITLFYINDFSWSNCSLNTVPNRARKCKINHTIRCENVAKMSITN